MKKKHLLFLTISSLSLSGCGFPIDQESAKTRLDEIENHEVNIDNINAVTISKKSEIILESKRNNIISKTTTNVEADGSINTKKYFVHLDVSASAGDSSTGLSMIEIEIWGYLKKDVYYSVLRYNKNTAEIKTYSTYSGEEIKNIKETFVDQSKNSIENLISIIDDENVIKNTKSYFEEQKGVTSSFRCSSFGKGYLGFKGTKQYDEYYYDGIKTSGLEKVNYQWANYILTKNNYSLELFGTDVLTGNYVKLSKKDSSSAKPWAKINYPDLSEYECVDK